MNFVVLAIPFFLFLIGIELFVNWIRKQDTYAFNDTLNSLNLGMMSQVTGLVKKTIQFSFYVVLFNHWSLFDLGTESMWIWVVGFIAYDFCYYWSHRMSHEINILWASHVVHHQSEEYNLSTALRQTSGGFFTFIFYIPLALIGFDPIIILTVGSLNLVYQFWVHTKHINKMPAWYEAVFITPSNHRVHHAQNPIYIDKNHGGVFVIWDRIFGTYHPELDEEPVIFGVTKPLASWNPIWANLEVYWGLFIDALRTKSWKDKLTIWFKPTGWRPADVAEKYPHPTFDPYKQVKFDTPLNIFQKLYLLSQHITLIAIVLFVILNAVTFDNTSIYLSTAAILAFMLSMGSYQEQRRGATVFELAKIVIISLFSLDYLSSVTHITLGVSIWAGLSIALLVLGAKQTDNQLIQQQ
jgi:sterol desaturase/sphingolipid hydroxylase (fatty acid hydroxylase superfamily)